MINCKRHRVCGSVVTVTVSKGNAAVTIFQTVTEDPTATHRLHEHAEHGQSDAKDGSAIRRRGDEVGGGVGAGDLQHAGVQLRVLHAGQLAASAPLLQRRRLGAVEDGELTRRRCIVRTTGCLMERGGTETGTACCSRRGARQCNHMRPHCSCHFHALKRSATTALVRRENTTTAAAARAC